MKTLLGLVCFFALTLSTAQAFAWEATSEGPDVFGTTKILASELGFRDGLVVQCDSKEVLHIAYIAKKKEFDDVPDTPATLYIQGSSAEPIILDATLRVWNDNFSGVVASGRVPALLGAIKEIEAAKGKINIGVEVFGNQFSASLSSRGSTSAMQRVIDGCKLADIAPPPA